MLNLRKICLIFNALMILLSMFLVSCVGPTAGKSSKKTQEPILLSAEESKLPESVYRVISEFTGVSIEQRNSIMKATLQAMTTHAGDQQQRDDAINNAVLANGGDTGFADAIKSAVDGRPTAGKSSKKTQEPILLSAEESKLPESVYRVISEFTGASIEQRNSIMKATLQSMTTHAGDQQQRDDAINNAVMSNGGDTGFADAIRSAVDGAAPIRPRTKIAQYWLMDWQDLGELPDFLDKNGNLETHLSIENGAPKIDEPKAMARFYWEEIDFSKKEVDVRTGNKFYLLVTDINQVKEISLDGSNCKEPVLKKSFDNLALYRIECENKKLPEYFYQDIYLLRGLENLNKRADISSTSIDRYPTAILNPNFLLNKSFPYKSFAIEYWQKNGLDPNGKFWGTKKPEVKLAECALAAEKARFALGLFKKHESNPKIKEKDYVAKMSGIIAKAEGTTEGNDCYYIARGIPCFKAGSEEGDCPVGWGSIWEQNAEFSVRNIAYAKNEFLASNASKEEKSAFEDVQKSVRVDHKVPIYREEQKIWGGLDSSGQMNKIGRIWQFLFLPAKVEIK